MVTKTTENYKYGRAKSLGLSMVEVVVVITIIIIIVTIVLLNAVQARKKGRDARRIADMQAVMLGLENYREKNGYYPGVPEGIPNTGQRLGVGDTIDTVLAPYMGEVPRDPIDDGVTYYYSYDPQHSTPTGWGNRAVVGFHTSETGIVDRQTDAGGDQGLDTAAYNRVLLAEGHQ